MQTPRVEWFVSKGQRLPIGQSPPDVTGARLLLMDWGKTKFGAAQSCGSSLSSSSPQTHSGPGNPAEPAERRRPAQARPPVAEAEGKLTPLEERGLFLYCFLLLPLSFLNLGPWTPSAGTPDGWAA
ncbi:Rho GTPase-activating protein 44 [Manis javanica]|nr:Rho GTPase-activating protein 44 [Manis javanica]